MLREHAGGVSVERGVARHHLVVLHSQYLDRMLDGRKRIECRLSKIRKPPFECVSPGDLLWFKPPSQPIRAFAVAGRCEFREIHEPDTMATMLARYENDICADPGFFADAPSWARFASLIWIQSVAAIRPMRIQKSDQRAWVALGQMPYPGMRLASHDSPTPTSSRRHGR